jgi:hypothetical protein
MISSHGQTDVRKRRSLNEDAVFASDQLFIVCDGFDAKSQELTDGNIVLRCSDGQTNCPPTDASWRSSPPPAPTWREPVGCWCPRPTRKAVATTSGPSSVATPPEGPSIHEPPAAGRSGA